MIDNHTFRLKHHIPMLEKLMVQTGADVGARCRAVEAYANTLVAFYRGWLLEYERYNHVAHQITQYLGQNEILNRSIKDIARYVRNQNISIQINTDWAQWAPVTKPDLDRHAQLLDASAKSVVHELDKPAPSDAMVNPFPRAGAANAYAATITALCEERAVLTGISKILDELQEMQASEDNSDIHRALGDVLEFIRARKTEE